MYATDGERVKERKREREREGETETENGSQRGKSRPERPGSEPSTSNRHHDRRNEARTTNNEMSTSKGGPTNGTPTRAYLEAVAASDPPHLHHLGGAPDAAHGAKNVSAATLRARVGAVTVTARPRCRSVLLLLPRDGGVIGLRRAFLCCSGADPAAATRTAASTTPMSPMDQSKVRAIPFFRGHPVVYLPGLS